MSYCTFPHLGQAGRLGNQLIQVAATVGIARSHGLDPMFPANWSYRPFFSLPDSMYGTEVGTPATVFAGHLDPAARVYLQDLSLWEFIADEVRALLAPRFRASMRLSDYVAFRRLPRPVLGVHVRRGDNVQANDPLTPDKHLWHPLRPLSYYEEAIALLAPRAASVAVFSDDPEWCRENLTADYFHVGYPRPKEHEPDYLTAPVLDWIDWFLLASCDLHVLSNSTFGLMAAWASGDTEAVYPWPWYGPRLDYADASLMIPAGWRRVPHAL